MVNKRRDLFLFFIMVLLAISPENYFAQKENFKEPVLITSCGQSPGALKIQIFMIKGKYDYEYKPLVSADVLRKDKISTVIIVVGSSLKGMSAAGVTVNSEIDRIKEIIKVAKENNIKIIAAHIEGKGKRIESAGSIDELDESLIAAVFPNADMFLVRSDGNEDERFSNSSKKNNIPIRLFDKNLQLAKVLKNIFGK